jgi:hypothetical protein
MKCHLRDTQRPRGYVCSYSKKRGEVIGVGEITNRCARMVCREGGVIPVYAKVGWE